jgi:hypothetical protein
MIVKILFQEIHHFARYGMWQHLAEANGGVFLLSALKLTGL